MLPADPGQQVETWDVVNVGRLTAMDHGLGEEKIITDGNIGERRS